MPSPLLSVTRIATFGESTMLSWVMAFLKSPTTPKSTSLDTDLFVKSY